MGSFGNLTPAWRAFQLERDQFSDLLNDLGERPGAIDVFKDAAAAAFYVGKFSSATPVIAFQGPAPGACREDQNEKQSDGNFMGGRSEPVMSG